MKEKIKFGKYTIEELEDHVTKLSDRIDPFIHRGKLDEIRKILKWYKKNIINNHTGS